jgi:hypothetical protein
MGTGIASVFGGWVFFRKFKEPLSTKLQKIVSAA